MTTVCQQLWWQCRINLEKQPEKIEKQIQQMLAGVSIYLQAHTPGIGMNTLAGYAAFGAFYFLLAAFRLSKMINRMPGPL